jgi:hypothetical protein
MDNDSAAIAAEDACLLSGISLARRQDVIMFEKEISKINEAIRSRTETCQRNGHTTGGLAEMAWPNIESFCVIRARKSPISACRSDPCLAPLIHQTSFPQVQPCLRSSKAAKTLTFVMTVAIDLGLALCHPRSKSLVHVPGGPHKKCSGKQVKLPIRRRL